MSDAEIAALRDSMYSFAACLVAAYSADWAALAATGISHLTEDERVEIEERVAILEFEGGLTRDQAERLALSRYNARVSRPT